MVCSFCRKSKTKAKINFQNGHWICSLCSQYYSGPSALLEKEIDYVNSDFFYKVKKIIKSCPKIFLILGYLIGPLLPNFKLQIWKQVKTLNKNPNSKIINLGSGTSDYGENVLNVDIVYYKNTDLISDISDLPVEDEQFDLVILTEVIEHLEEPTRVINESFRILKQGGIVIITSPFMIGFHASPNDFQRFTIPGIKQLLHQFEVLEVKSYGPTGSLLWILQEWLALWFSFSSKKLHVLFVLVFMVLTSPLKLIDLILNWNSNSSNIASTYYVLARKSKTNYNLE